MRIGSDRVLARHLPAFATLESKFTCLAKRKRIKSQGLDRATDDRLSPRGLIADENYANQAEKLEARRPALYVCRAMHSGVWVAGTQKEKEKVCTVTIHGTVQSYEKYELLENVDGAARISWVYWDRFSQPHLGAVYVDKMILVARHEVPKDKRKPRYTHYIGSLSSAENFGTIVFVNEVGVEIASSIKSSELGKKEKCVAPF